MKHRDRNAERVRAHVVLKGPGGAVTSGSPVSAENVQSFVCDASVRERVRADLEKFGFSVRRVSPLAITVEAPRGRFEAVFLGRLKRLTPAGRPSGKRATSKSGGSPEEDLWTWVKSPVIPAELRDAVDTVVLPQPTRTLT